MPEYNQVTLDFFLVDGEGNFIVDENGDRFIIDTVNLETEGSFIPDLTSAAAQEFASGRRLAVTPNGPPKTWEIRTINSDGVDKYVTVFNLRFIGGIHTSIYRALGQISGTYIRYGSKGIPDSIVGRFYNGSGPSASLVVPSSSEVGDDITLDVTFSGLPEAEVDSVVLTATSPSGSVSTVSSDYATLASDPVFTVTEEGTYSFRLVTSSSSLAFNGDRTDTTVVAPANVAPVINTFTVAPTVVVKTSRASP